MSQEEENSPLPETTILDGISKFCVKFGNLILGKIIKSVATGFQILRLKCTKFDIGWGSDAGGACSALQDPVAGLRALLLRRGEGKGEGGGEWEGKKYVLGCHLSVNRISYSSNQGS